MISYTEHNLVKVENELLQNLKMQEVQDDTSLDATAPCAKFPSNNNVLDTLHSQSPNNTIHTMDLFFTGFGEKNDTASLASQNFFHAFEPPEHHMSQTSHSSAENVQKANELSDLSAGFHSLNNSMPSGKPIYPSQTSNDNETISPSGRQLLTEWIQHHEMELKKRKEEEDELWAKLKIEAKKQLEEWYQEKQNLCTKGKDSEARISPVHHSDTNDFDRDTLTPCSVNWKRVWQLVTSSNVTERNEVPPRNNDATLLIQGDYVRHDTKGSTKQKSTQKDTTRMLQLLEELAQTDSVH